MTIVRPCILEGGRGVRQEDEGSTSSIMNGADNSLLFIQLYLKYDIIARDCSFSQAMRDHTDVPMSPCIKMFSGSKRCIGS